MRARWIWLAALAHGYKMAAIANTLAFAVAPGIVVPDSVRAF